MDLHYPQKIARRLISWLSTVVTLEKMVTLEKTVTLENRCDEFTLKANPGTTTIGSLDRHHPRATLDTLISGGRGSVSETMNRQDSDRQARRR
jgi:hypothetical protein